MSPSDEDHDFVVEPGEAGRPLDGVLRARLGGSWSAVRALVERGKVNVDGARVTDGTVRVRAGAAIAVRPRARRVEPGMLDDSAIAYFDPHVVVVRKPAGISTIPYEPGERGTLEEKTRLWLVRRAKHAPHASLGVVHRIDKETSGLVVFARTFAAKKVLGQAFRVHAIERRYVAIVHGVLEGKRTFRSHLVDDRGDGLRGTARDPRVGERIGQLSITHVAGIEVLSRDVAQDGATLLACALETGRTHQIRIHLSEARHPLVGDRVYTRDRLRAERPLIEAPRLMLHAMVLGFEHPVTKKPLRFVEPLPEDLRKVASKLARHDVDVAADRLPL
ncbi:MAG: RluA family pseudouridine synthase [Deltaproteobacteria bacterium]|nr:RluA family pseudouridine synthase [Deltaproteobacteria bacterium]